MEGTYEVSFKEKKVGSVQVKRVGLYYELECRCSHCNGQMVELIAERDGFRKNLGLLLPMNGGMGIKMCIPAKRFGEGKLCFSLHLRPEEDEKLVEINADMPFAYLQQLQMAHLVLKQGKPMIGIKKIN